MVIALRAALGISALILFHGFAQAQEMADKIYSGGQILTMNDAAMRAEAVGVKDGKIIAAGKADDVMKLKGAATQIIDLGGHTLIPGFFDAHGHVMAVGLQALSANLLPPPDGEDTSIPELQRILKDWLQPMPMRSRSSISSSASVMMTRSLQSCGRPIATNSMRCRAMFRSMSCINPAISELPIQRRSKSSASLRKRPIRRAA